MLRIKTECYGSCGELFQGIVDNEELLISYHIDLKTELLSNQHDSFELPEKMSHALWLMGYKNIEKQFKRVSHIPVGKGCASSTADILCALQLGSLLSGKNLSPEQLTRLCASLEPSDSIAFPLLTSINPVTGEKIEEFNFEPEWFVYMLEPDDVVLTKQLPRLMTCRDFDRYYSTEMYDLLRESMNKKDLEALGYVAQECSRLNEVRLKKPYLDELMYFVKKRRLIGLNIAHSGTVVGLLLTKEHANDIDDLEDELSREKLATYYTKRRLCRIRYEGVTSQIDD